MTSIERLLEYTRRRALPFAQGILNGQPCSRHASANTFRVMSTQTPASE